MLDMDLAEIYGVQTKVLKQAVRRNIERFPEEFMFELSTEEFANLRSQIVTSSWDSIRYAPMAFSEHGIAMLSSVLKSKQAITVNIQIIRVFIRMRELIRKHQELEHWMEEIEKKVIGQDEKIALVFEYLEQFQKQSSEKKRVGFRRKNEKGTASSK